MFLQRHTTFYIRMMALDYVINEVWGLDCEITGLIAGTDTCHCDRPDAPAPMMKTGKLTAYLYSQETNRDLWKVHDPALGHNLYTTPPPCICVPYLFCCS